MSYYTVKSMSQRHDFSQASFRDMIFHAKTNGLWPAIIRIGRKVMIHEMMFLRWLKDSKCLVREEEAKSKKDDDGID